MVRELAFAYPLFATCLVMSIALSFTLRHTWGRLLRLPRSGDSPAAQQELHALLAATVTALFQSYPDQLSAAQHQLLRHLLVVEHQYATMPESELAKPASWQALLDTLLASVAATCSVSLPPARHLAPNPRRRSLPPCGGSFSICF